VFHRSLNQQRRSRRALRARDARSAVTLHFCGRWMVGTGEAGFTVLFPDRNDHDRQITRLTYT